MKLRMLGLVVAFPMLAFGVACEDSGEGEEGAGGAAEPAADAGVKPDGEGAAPAADGAAAPDGAAAEAGPGDACDKLIEAIGAKNVDGVVAMTGDGADKITPESIEGISSTLSSASCGDATVEGDKATIPVTAGEDTREIVFAKAGDSWKFDANAYLAKYAANGEKGKGKGKGKEGKGKKAKKAKGKKKG